MKFITTPMRSLLWILLTAAAVTISFAVVEPAAACSFDPSQADQDKAKEKEKDKDKEKEKDKKKTVKTDSGLQYTDIKEGEGDPPAEGQFCDVHYTLWLWQNGAKAEKSLDSSVDRGEPFSFHIGVKEVIKGWDEGVATMKVGGKRELLIPPDLAFGERGAGGRIPPNATLFYEVELLAKWEKTESGLEYRDIKEGTGAKPEAGQSCEVHYTGWLWGRGGKGRKFDSSVDRGEPFSFPLGEGRVIKGWDEGVATMKAGGKRRLLIPAKLGYGARGSPPDIPANATLLFDVELLKVR